MVQKMSRDHSLYNGDLTIVMMLKSIWIVLEYLECFLRKITIVHPTVALHNLQFAD